MHKRQFIAAFFIATCALALSSEAEACSCGGQAPVSTHVERSTAVFVGTAESVTGGMPKPIVATFRVQKVYRGGTPERPMVSGSGTNCDVQFAHGETYLVYAAESRGVLFTHECTRTRPISSAAEDLKYLDNLASGRPQALIYGDVFQAAMSPDGTAVKRALFETLMVVAVGGGTRYTVSTDRWGPYQIVLSPGDYVLWVERGGQRVSTPTRLTLRAGEDRGLAFTAKYR